MPKSSVRKKKLYTPPADMRPQAAAARKPSPTWIPATGVGLVVFAIVWLVTYYLTQQWTALGDSFMFLTNLSWGNLLVGFGAMLAALGLLSKWR